MFFLLAVLVADAIAGVGATPTLPDGFAALGEGRVAGVIDGDTVVLADGRQVRLVGIMAPKLPLGRPGFEPWPWAPEAKAGLEALVLDQRVEMWGSATTRDRHGRVLAHLVRARDGLWIQGAMVEQGLARVYSFVDNRAGVAALYRIEDEARRAGRGLWSHPDYTVVQARDAERAVRSFALVEGRVLKVTRVGSRTFLNYGADWRRDFTVKIGRRAARLFTAESLDLTQFAGRLVRVRGWVRWENGPMVEVTHPEQIEILDARSGRGTVEAERQ